MMGDNGPTNPNGSFIYDTAIYYDEYDPRKKDIQKYRNKLEHKKWGFSVCDPHRDGRGEQLKRFKQSFLDSRHAIVFLSPDVVERMNRNLEDGVEFRICTFLSGILESHDPKLKRRLIPVVFESDNRNFQKPFLLGDFSILCPERTGFFRHLYRSLSKLPGPDTITPRQIRQRVDAMGRDRHTDGVVTEVAAGLDIPVEVTQDVKEEYGGHKAMLIEVLECWRLHRGPEATAAILDGILERVVALPPQSWDESTECAETAPSPIMDTTFGPTENQAHIKGSGNIIVYAGNNSTINMYQNEMIPSDANVQAAAPQSSSEPTVEAEQAVQERDEGSEEVNNAEGAPVSTSTNDEVLSDGMSELDLNTPAPPVGPTQGASAPATNPKEFYSLPATGERTSEKGVRAKIGKWFGRFSRKSTPGADPRPVHRSASTSHAEGGDNQALMMTRRSSCDSGMGSTITGKGTTSPAVPAKSTANEAIEDEDKLVSALPNPPNHQVEERKTLQETRTTKKPEASAPLVST
ncbi:uncharacterized protein LOC144867094 [Branchiostoma floridae x Branchiostoma japonicum]